MKLLVVEDDVDVARLLAVGLGRHGFEVECVDNGVEALARAYAGDVSLVLLDLGLPDLEGLAVLQFLRGAADPLPVVILSGRGLREDRIRGLELGASDYVAKPFAFKDLVARIRAALRAAGRA